MRWNYRERVALLYYLSQKSDKEKTNSLLSVLYQLVGPKGKLSALCEILVTKKCKLYEMAAVITELGSDRQSIHIILTVFLPGIISTKDQQECNLNGRYDFMKKRTPYFVVQLI